MSAKSATLRMKKWRRVLSLRSAPVDCVVEAPGVGVSFRDRGEPGPMTEDGDAVMSLGLGVRQR